MNTFKNLKLAGILLLLPLFAIGCVKGPKGDAGIPGSGKIVATMNCAQTISGLDPDLNGLMIEYDAVLTSGGDVYATATIVESGYQASGTAFYAADQAGAENALVLVTADYIGAANGGLWKIRLNRDTLVTHIRYEDPSDLVGPIEDTFSPSACTAQYW